MSQVVRTFDLYNTVFYWQGYTVENYGPEIEVAKAYYNTNQSSNIIGSKIDFFNALQGVSSTTNVFTLSTTFENLDVLWKQYWWDEAMFYSLPSVKSELLSTESQYYQTFGDSVGTLCYTTYNNTFNNVSASPLSPTIKPLVLPVISSSIDSFYQTVNSLFNDNITQISSGTSYRDSEPNNGNLIMPDTDQDRYLDSIESLTETVNNLYPGLSSFLPYNVERVGNLLTPLGWKYEVNCEEKTIQVDINNTNNSQLKHLNLEDIKTE